MQSSKEARPAALGMENVAFHYGDRCVFRGLSLTIRAGEFVGLIGPNGAGKTTLIRLLCGILSPSEGRVLLGDRDLAHLPRRTAARTLAFVPQETTAAFPFRAREAVLMGRYPHRGSFAFETEADLERARIAMESTDTETFSDRYVHELSGGERQRVLLARALAQEPEILLLDEPTSHLDLNHQARFLDLIDQTRMQGGRTVVFVSHDVNMISRRAERLVLLQDGAVVADGPPEAVITPEIMEAAFGIPLRLVPDPLTGIPFVFPDSRSERHAP